MLGLLCYKSLTLRANLLYIQSKFIVVPRAWLGRAFERYGLKVKFHIGTVIVLLCVWILALPATALSQGGSSWWGSASWWDWSDYRGFIGVRIFMPTVDGSVEKEENGVKRTVDFSEFGITNDPQLFKSLYFEFYIDRLGLRGEVEEDHKFQGRVGNLGTARISELNMSGNRLGLDLDIIRNPFARAGIDFTYHMEKVKFQDRHQEDSNSWTEYSGENPMTVGFHGRAFPLRIRDVPLTVAGRIRFPIPFLDRPKETKITEWEVSAGLRPAVWETSLLGHTAFSFALEGGYRHTYLNMDAGRDGEVNVRAQWGGAFIQGTVVY